MSATRSIQATTLRDKTTPDNAAAVDSNGRVAQQDFPGLGEVQDTPTANTLLGRLKDNYTELTSIDSWLELIDTTLDAINLTTGIKKIVDALPTGANWIGKILVGDGTNTVDVPADGESLASGRGFAILGKDAEDYGRFLLAEENGTLRVASQPPSPPPGTTEFVLSQSDTVLEIGLADSPHDTESAVIGNGVDLYLQSFSSGAAGDPSERGSRVDIVWTASSVEHVVARLYIAGQSVERTLSDVNKARDGTTMTGNGTDTKLIIRRYRLSNADQEVDAEVRGYTQ